MPLLCKLGLHLVTDLKAVWVDYNTGMILSVPIAYCPRCNQVFDDGSVAAAAEHLQAPPILVPCPM